MSNIPQGDQSNFVMLDQRILGAFTTGQKRQREWDKSMEEHIMGARMTRSWKWKKWMNETKWQMSRLTGCQAERRNGEMKEEIKIS